MLTTLIAASPDLRKLWEEGYSISIKDGALLLISNVPYVNSKRQVRLGTLVSSLALAGDRTAYDGTHTVHWIVDYPCDAQGVELEQIRNSQGEFKLGTGLTARFQFSAKPRDNYRDYHHKMSTYVEKLQKHARQLNSEAAARPHAIPARTAE